MPLFPHLHKTAIYNRRNNWSFKSCERKKYIPLQHSLPSAAQHAAGYLSVLWSPTQGMTQGLSFHYTARHRMLGVMASNKGDCETVMKGPQPIFQVYLIMDHAYRSMAVQQTTHKMWKHASLRMYSYRLAVLDFQSYNNKTQVQQNLPAF